MAQLIKSKWIEAGGVNTSNLATNAVTAQKIAAGAIVKDKLAVASQATGTFGGVSYIAEAPGNETPIQIQYVNDATSPGESVSVEFVDPGYDIVVHIEEGVTTPETITDLINNDPTISSLVFAVMVGGSPIAMAMTPLTGAVEFPISTTLNIASGIIVPRHLDSGVPQAILETKLVAARNGVLSFAAAGIDDVVTTPVTIAATTDSPTTSVNNLGIYTGAVDDSQSWLKVLIRVAGTDNGIDDGTGDEVFGKLTENAGVYTLSYYTAANGVFTMPSTNIDFFFVEIFNEFNKPIHAGLLPVAGVVDATQASALNNHITNATGAHASSAISDATVPTNYSQTGDAVSNHLAGIDAALGLRLTSGAADLLYLGITATAADSAKLNGQSASYYATAQSVSDHTGDTTGAHAASAVSVAATATNYTAATADVEAHLAGIDAALLTAGSPDHEDDVFRISNAITPSKKIAFSAANVAESTVRTITMANRDVALDNVTQQVTETITLVAGDITAKYKDLANVPKTVTNVRVFPNGGVEQLYTTDFTVITDGTDVKRLQWSGLGLDGVLEAGDILTVSYQING